MFLIIEDNNSNEKHFSRLFISFVTGKSESLFKFLMVVLTVPIPRDGGGGGRRRTTRGSNSWATATPQGLDQRSKQRNKEKDSSKL